MNPIHSTKEDIQYCMSIMEKTIQNKRGHKIDLTFIEILSNDIKSLEKTSLSEKTIKQLYQQLDQVSKKIFQSVDMQLMGKTENRRPLVGKQEPMHSLSQEYAEASSIRKGLEQIGTNFNRIPIAGDGHCFFRAIATQLLFSLQKMPKKQQIEVQQKVVSLISKHGDYKNLREQFNRCVKTLNDVINGKDPYISLLDQEKSNDLVAFLRTLASLHHSKNNQPTFIEEAKCWCEDTKIPYSKDSYINRMQDMKYAELGGHPEIVALEALLPIKIHVFQAKEFGENDNHNHFIASNDLIDIPLLYRPGHYDLLAKK